MTERAATRRLFFALWPSAEQRARIVNATAEVIKQSRGRPIAHENLHITTFFIGAVPEARVVQVHEVGARIRAARFELVFDQLENWPGADVLCLTCSYTPAAVAGLHEALRKALSALGFHSGDKPFTPHITLARDTRARRRREPFEALPWSVDDFVLVQSNMTRTGSQYEVTGRWPLVE